MTNKKVILFGGQDSLQERLFNDLYILNLEDNTLKEHIYQKDKVIPPKRNSHTMTKLNDQKAYLFGGANTDGPLKDLYELNLETLDFTRVALDESETSLPMIEMHTAHIYKGTHLLIIGGRKCDVGQPVESTTFNDEIYSIELATGKVGLFGKLPTAIGSHVSLILDDKYLICYGGTNGFRFFDSILRYEIDAKEWTLMLK